MILLVRVALAFLALSLIGHAFAAAYSGSAIDMIASLAGASLAVLVACGRGR